jgi:ABC-type transport system involved in multi-copper enzyme maturation permease subunit
LVGVAGTPVPRDAWPVILFTLIPIIVCMLGLLLWATPIVYTELEGNTWPYLAVRPHGRTSVLLGKYVTAVVWTALAGLTGLTISILIVQAEAGFNYWLVLATLVLLSCVSYGALFTFLGVLMHKRPIVTAVAYALILEFVVGWIPAMINQFTVQLRLRTLLFTWIDWETSPPPEALNILSATGTATRHVVILLVASVILIAASVWLLRQKTLVGGSDA